MELIVNIPDQAYDWIKTGFPDEKDGEYAVKVIQEGKPLLDAIKEIEAKISPANGSYYNEGLSQAIKIICPKYYEDLLREANKI